MPGQLLVAHLVAVAKQLVAAADGQHRRAARRPRRASPRSCPAPCRGPRPPGRGPGRPRCRRGRGASGSSASPIDGRAELEADPAPLAAGSQHRDVAAVGVDVHQLRVQRADAQRRSRRLQQHDGAAHVVARSGHLAHGPSGVKPASAPSASSPAAVTESRRSVKTSSVSSPFGETAWRWRSTATKSRLVAHVDRGGGEHPAVELEHVGERGQELPGRHAAEGVREGHGQQAARLEVGAHGRQHGGPAARARPAAGPPASAGSPAGRAVPRSNERASAAWARTGRPRSRARAAHTPTSSGSASSATTSCPRAARSSATRPVPAPMSSTGEPRSSASSRHSGRSAA